MTDVYLDAPSDTILQDLQLFPLEYDKIYAAASQILQQRLKFVGNTRDWFRYLNWNSATGDAMAPFLVAHAGTTLINETFEGYAFVDAETVLAIKRFGLSSCRPELQLWATLVLSINQETMLLDWRFREFAETSPFDNGLKRLETLDAVKECVVQDRLASKDTSGDDDYWNAYGQDSDDEPVQEKTTTAEASDADYYDRYGQVETAIPEASPSLQISPPAQHLPAGADGTATADVALREAMLKHCATTIQSLQALCLAGGISSESFKGLMSEALQRL